MPRAAAIETIASSMATLAARSAAAIPTSGKLVLVPK